MRQAQRVFQVGQCLRLLLHLRGEQLGLLFTHHGQFGQIFNLDQRIAPARGPLRGLLFERCQALHHALTAFDHKADLRLQAAHIGAGLVQQTLGLIDVIARGVMRLAHSFQIGLNTSQIGQAALQRVHGAGGICLDFGLIRLGLTAFQKPLLMLLERDLRLQRIELARHLGLLLQLVQVGIEFTQDIVNAGQVLARIREAIFRLTPALLVF